MPQLVLGPMLRHVEVDEATVWVETDAPCEVAVLDATARTFCVAGRHYALLELTGLTSGAELPYTVRLDGEQAWPRAGDPFPPPVIRTLGGGEELRVVFGSCRATFPHEPPWTLDPSDHERGQGIDALRALGLRLAGGQPEDLPHCLLMLGDQVYADELSPHMCEVTAARQDPTGVPDDELGDFEEYAAAYHEAWGEPVIRWLLSTVPTAMIFDDHEIHAQWKISQGWMDGLRAEPWFDGHIADGLMAYWVYQHLGNLSCPELRKSELYDLVRAEDDAAAALREHMRGANDEPGHSRWSFSRDLGCARLVVIDSRAGRVIEPSARQMVDDGEWEWIVERCSGDHEHLLLASSVPFFLTHGLHYLEAWDEAVADGVWGDRAARVAEKLRQTGVMDHWASFHRSFQRLTGFLTELATGVHGDPPASIVMLSGDVHHCYLAQIGFPAGTQVHSAVWQAVCSGYRKSLAPREKLAMRLGNSHIGAVLARALARTAGVEPQTNVGWRLAHDPCYDNQVGTLTLGPGHGHLLVETTEGAHWREPRLRTVFEHKLAAARAPDEGSPVSAVP
ncbi:MAG: alkaline phosphatase family protein [Actinomycetota bacterium]|nr:alkaline phosphatase family protein [Actinomycetota bacterium]